MDTLTAADVPTSSPRAAPNGATGDALPDVAAGWLVLRDCALGGGGPRIGLVLIHPAVGVALVDSASKHADAAGRLRFALDARRFSAIFNGYPPVACVDPPADRSADLGRILAAEFKAQPPLALAGGDSWVRTARAAIEAEMPVPVPEPRRAKRRGASPRRAAALIAVCAFSAAALVLASVMPGRDPGTAIRPAVVAAWASDILPGFQHEAAPPDDADFTPADVAAALRSADAAAGSEAAAVPAESGEAAPSTAVAGGGRPESAPAGPATRPDHQSWDDSPTAALPDAPEAVPPLQPSVAGTGPPPDSGSLESGQTPATANTEGPEPPSAAVAAAVPFVDPGAGSDRATRQALPPATALPDAADPANEPRSPPKRATATPSDAPPRPVPQAPATVSRRAASPAAGAPSAEAGGVGRCREILVRATMGGALSDGDKDFLRRGCQPRG